MPARALLLFLIAPLAWAADGPISSASFCLFELPGDAGNQRLLNLGIVQYVEILRDELRIAYGGGNLGSGYEARIPIKSREEGTAIVQRMQQTARECR